MADATKVSGALLDWTLLGDTATDSPSVDSGTLDVGAGSVDVVLHITVAHAELNAAAVGVVTGKVFVRSGATDETWNLLTTFGAGGGVCTLEAIAATSGAGEANPERIQVADTTDWDTGLGERLFVLDSTLVNSEVVTVFGWADNDYYIAADALTNAHADTADLLDGVNGINIDIPNGIRYVKVTFHNSDDCDYAVRIDYSSVTEYV